MFTRLADKTGGPITLRGRFAPGYPAVDDFKHPFRNRSSTPVGPPVDVLSAQSAINVH